jgi:Uncharacterised nucleotidyltransferase
VVAARSRPTPSPLASEPGRTGPLQHPLAEAAAQLLRRLPARDSEGKEPAESTGATARQHAYCSLRLVRELLALLDLFERRHVRAIPFKGPVLAVQLYGDPAARYYEDLDILVHERQFDQALALLHARRYGPSPELRRSPLRRWLRLEGQCHLVRDAVRVELHFALGSFGFPVPLDFDALWSRLESVRLGGRIVRTMAREDLALYLAAHGAKHAWERVEWIVDFAQLVRTWPDLDWLRIAARARAQGQERMLLLALRLASDLSGVAPPQALALRVSGDNRIAALASDVHASLLGARPFTDQPGTRRTFHLRVMERLRDRARYAGHVLFTPGPAEWAMVPLPGRLAWLYYVIRPIRIAGTYVRGLLKKSRAAMPRSLGSPPPR